MPQEAFVTVTDAAGRVLFRRPATSDEIAEALVAADRAERNARDTLAEIGQQRREAAEARAAAPQPPPAPPPMRDVTPGIDPDPAADPTADAPPEAVDARAPLFAEDIDAEVGG